MNCGDTFIIVNWEWWLSQTQMIFKCMYVCFINPMISFKKRHDGADILSQTDSSRVHLCPQLQLEDYRVDGVQGGRAAEPAGPSAWKPDGVVRRWDSDTRGLLRPDQQRDATQPRLAQEQRR